MVHPIRSARALAFIGTLLVLLAAGVQATQPSRLIAADTSVSMSGSAFGPASISIAVGDTVTWTNDDTAVHDVTEAGGAWTSGVMSPGETFSQTFTDPGTYTYRCLLHAWMWGTVVVGQQ